MVTLAVHIPSSLIMCPCMIRAWWIGLDALFWPIFLFLFFSKKSSLNYYIFYLCLFIHKIIPTSGTLIRLKSRLCEHNFELLHKPVHGERARAHKNGGLE